MNILNLCKEIYDYSFAVIATKEFASIANITIKNEEGYLRCVFSNCTYDVETTMKEFENYIIDLNNQRGLL